jgi:hypothetical protein
VKPARPLVGDGKEKRKIPVIGLQAIDLPTKRDNVLRAYSSLFLGPFWA